VNTDDGSIKASFGPEERLILRCLQRHAESIASGGAGETGVSCVDGALELPRDHIDWDRLTLAAGSHGVLPLVYRWLKSAGEIPPEALTRMRAEF
jgi:hypothetical protein